MNHLKMDSSTDSDNLRNIIKDINDPINDYKWDEARSAIHHSLK